jgi:hypothetical protein
MMEDAYKNFEKACKKEKDNKIKINEQKPPINNKEITMK